MKLEYRITEEARKKIFVETGRDPGAWQQIDVDPAELSADDRRLLVALSPILPLDRVRLSMPVWVRGSASVESFTLAATASDAGDLLSQYRAARALAEINFAAARDDAARQAIEAYRTWNEPLEPQYRLFQEFAESPLRDDLIAAYDTAKTAAAAIRAAKLATKQRKEDEEAAEKAARLAERATWAAEHGSPRLRKCIAQGYDCQRLYVAERAAIEHPGYAVDFQDKAAWKSRSGPSEKALDEAARVGGEVVWLTVGVDEEPVVAYDDDRDGVEAVVIRSYLGKYDLVKVAP